MGKSLYGALRLSQLYLQFHIASHFNDLINGRYPKKEPLWIISAKRFGE